MRLWPVREPKLSSSKVDKASQSSVCQPTHPKIAALMSWVSAATRKVQVPLESSELSKGTSQTNYSKKLPANVVLLVNQIDKVQPRPEILDPRLSLEFKTTKVQLAIS